MIKDNTKYFGCFRLTFDQMSQVYCQRYRQKGIVTYNFGHPILCQKISGLSERWATAKNYSYAPALCATVGSKVTLTVVESVEWCIFAFPCSMAG